jgi:hypothetical protein
MSDRDVEREIQENQRRVRDEQDVGLDEDVVEGQENNGSFLDDLGGILGNDDDSREGDDQRRKDDSGI